MPRTDWKSFGSVQANHALDDRYAASGSTSLRVSQGDDRSIEVLKQSLADEPVAGEVRTKVRIGKDSAAMVFFRVQDVDNFYVTWIDTRGETGILSLVDGEQHFGSGSPGGGEAELLTEEFMDVRVQFWQHPNNELRASWDRKVDGEWVSLGADAYDPDPTLTAGGIGVGQYPPMLVQGSAWSHYDETTVAYPTDA